MPLFRDINAPDTNWRPSSEDPLPYLFSRASWLGFVYRWFALRPLDGHARSNATFRTGGTQFYSRTGAAPFPGEWFHTMPRWKQALFTRLPFTTWALSFPAAACFHMLTAYLGAYLSAVVSIVKVIVSVLSWG